MLSINILPQIDDILYLITYIILEDGMDNKPKMYQNNTKKEFHNNKRIYMSYDNNTNTEADILKSNNDIRKKVNNIMHANDFIYSKMVHLIIGNDTITRKIIGIFGNSIVTIDNEYIPLDNIKDIYI